MSYQCFLCPNRCLISDNSFGNCGVRGSKDGESFLPYHGVISAASMDPIEKKPLYHFHPGTAIFSVGFFGCSLACPFCQNSNISKEFSSSHGRQKLAPRGVVDVAIEQGSFGIAYTYSEPIVHYEWVIECAEHAASRGLKNILVTNGYINPEPGKELLKNIDAVNIDLKSFSDSFYKTELKGSLQPVLEFIEYAAGTVHTELTTLIIPGKNDSTDELKSAVDFIAGLNKNIPWHLSAYYPAYNYSIPPTEPASLRAIAERASEKLDFVFTGNISDSSNSFCPDCGNLLIERSGYHTRLPGIADGKCSSCGAEVSVFGIII